MKTLQERIEKWLPVYAAVAIVIYLVSEYALHSPLYRTIGLILLAIGAAPLVIDLVIELLKKNFGVDLIAVLAIVVSLLLGQFLTGLVIVLMLSGGEALEEYAQRRARKELTALLEAAPSIAHKKTGDSISDVALSEVAVGDIVVVKPGEVVPVDGIVQAGTASVDASMLTGESVPVSVSRGAQVLSGSVNKDGVLELQAIRKSIDSTYEQLIRLVRHAEDNKAPIVRLADRYTVVFTVITFVLALAAWFVSHDYVRVLSVLVVATPCPLILATPIAIISGMSQSAKRGVIVKAGGALEQLGQAQAFVFDKTGTITLGTPAVVEVKTYSGRSSSEVLGLAASLDQLSAHVLARSVVTEARNTNVALQYPKQFNETFGEGVAGMLDTTYYFGKLSFVGSNIAIPDAVRTEYEAFKKQGKMAVYLASEKELLGAVVLADTIRPESRNVFDTLKRNGIEHMVMLTGDKKEVAETISQGTGITEVIAESLPEQKVQAVQNLQHKGIRPVVMVGDGVNDAPALASADVGIAMGAHGSSASSEASDIVVTVDDLSRVAQAHAIAKRTIRVAIQGILTGIGLSVVLMVLAVLGYITPVYGAMMQEAIDVLVIFNALRVNIKV